jgi:hypothetical protein
MLLPFAAGRKEGRSFAVDTEQLVNCYVVTSQSRNAKTVQAIYGRPGLELFGNWGETPCRGLHQFGNRAYAVFSDRLEILRADGVSSTAAGNLLSTSGRVSMDDNGTQLMLVDGTNGYILPALGVVAVDVPLLEFRLLLASPSYGTADTLIAAPLLTLALVLHAPDARVPQEQIDTIATITDPNFPDNPQHVTYIDGFFVVQQRGTDQWFVSSLKDGSTWSALDFASAESDPDTLRNVIADHGELWLFGERSTEVWQNTGGQDFTFTRLEGAKIQWGVHAAWSVTRYADTVACLARDDHGTLQVVSFSQYQPVRISNDALEQRIAGFASSSDAVGYVTVDRGRHFYNLSFPSAGESWAYDVREDEWHETRSGVDGRFVPEHHAFFFTKHLVTDATTGNIYSMLDTVFADNTDEIFLKARGFHIHDSERLIGHASLQVVFEAGVGLATGQGEDPQAMLRWSNDGGAEWSNEHWRSIGAIGRRRARAIWRSLGRTRDRVYEFTITDPVKRVIVGMELKVQ